MQNRNEIKEQIENIKHIGDAQSCIIGDLTKKKKKNTGLPGME